MADVMRNSRKIVVSKTLNDVDEGPNWKNITLLREIKPENIRALKQREGKDITILGSGSIVQQLTKLRSIDNYALVVVPTLLGAGKSLFKDVDKTTLELREAKPFKNGITFLAYSLA